MNHDVFKDEVPRGQKPDDDTIGVDSIWGQDSNPHASDGSDGEALGGDHHDGNSVASEDAEVVDTSVAEVKRGNGKIFLVIATIGLLALGSAGYIVYSFFQKLNPEQVSAEASGPAVLVDVPHSMSSTQASLGTLDSASAAEPVDPQGSLPVIAPPHSSQVVQPTVVQSTDVPSVTDAPSEAAAPGAAAVLAAASQTPPSCVPVPQSCSPADKPQSKSRQVKEVKAQAKGSTLAAKAPKPARATKDLETQKRATEVQPRVESRTDMGRLTGYKLLAIEPRSGQHQQAWIRNAEGRMFIVRAGDSLEGARVNSVSFDSGVVTTERGVIRK